MARGKIGRNDPCPCGSGKKFKKCHLDRERQRPLTGEEVRKAWQRTHGKRLCLHPDAGPTVCAGKIVRAHTLRRSADLERIARDGHVYGIKALPFTPPERLVRPRLIGLNEASTFTGFCAYHDNRLFRPLERQPFEASNEQVALLAYRALCRELFAKRAAMEYVPTMREGDRGAPLEFQLRTQTTMGAYEAGAAPGLRDAEIHKSRFDELLRRADYGQIQYLVVRLNETPDVLFTSGYYPDASFAGERVQDLSDLGRTADLMTLSLITRDAGGAAVLAWLDSSPAGQRVAASLDALDDQEIPHAMVRFAYLGENTYSSPPWWEALSDENRTALVRRTFDSVNPFSPARVDRLKDDGLRVVQWTVRDRLVDGRAWRRVPRCSAIEKRHAATAPEACRKQGFVRLIIGVGETGDFEPRSDWWHFVASFGRALYNGSKPGRAQYRGMNERRERVKGRLLNEGQLLSFLAGVLEAAPVVRLRPVAMTPTQNRPDVIATH